MTTKFEDMTISELQVAKREIFDKIQELRKLQHEAKRVWNLRQNEVRVEQIAKHLSDEDRAHMAQVLSPEGVATKEGVGRPR